MTGDDAESRFDVEEMLRKALLLVAALFLLFSA